MANENPFQAEAKLPTKGGNYTIFRLRKLSEDRIADVDKLPYSIRVLLESCLRNVDNFIVNESDVVELANWSASSPKTMEVPFKPARVVLQDFTGVPCVVDLAAMRSAMQRLGGDPKKINPLVPVDLVIDHSVQVDQFRYARRRWSATWTWSSSGTASATSSSAGARRPSTTSASCRRPSASSTR